MILSLHSSRLKDTVLFGQLLFRQALSNNQPEDGYPRKTHTVASLVESESFLPISLFIHLPCWSSPEVILPGTTRGILFVVYGMTVGTIIDGVGWTGVVLGLVSSCQFWPRLGLRLVRGQHLQF